MEIATTRPETLLGDMAVAVNPEDERYRDLVGKELQLPLTDRTIPVIADQYVDKEFGTGCVKITPAHDPNDAIVGERHNLAVMNILTDDAKIDLPGSKYHGMDRYEARKAMVSDLEAQGLLKKVVPHIHNEGIHDRCGTTVEPMVKPQWFVKMEEMAKPAIEALKNGELQFVPENYGKTYLHWLENIKDWCISRQIWWGHRIPAYYCDSCGEMLVSEEMPKSCPKCGFTISMYQSQNSSQIKLCVLSKAIPRSKDSRFLVTSATTLFNLERIHLSAISIFSGTLSKSSARVGFSREDSIERALHSSSLQFMKRKREAFQTLFIKFRLASTLLW